MEQRDSTPPVPVSFVTNRLRRLVSFLVSLPDKTHATGGLGGPPVCRRHIGTKASREVRQRREMAATLLLRSPVPFRN